MTGITKDELEQMARDAGFPFNKYGLLQGDDEGEIDADAMLERLTNAILERAAVECDTTKDRYKCMAEEEDKTLLKDSDYWTHASVLAGAAYDIRALKINTGD